ncbi:MAG: type II secretion system F family protein [Thermoplasmata archaeon]
MTELPEDEFQKFEVQRKDFFKIKRTVQKTTGSYKIKLPKGSVPQYIKFNATQKIAWKLLSKYILTHNFKNKVKLEEDLSKSHILLRPEEYIAYSIFVSIIPVLPLIAIAIFFSIIGIVILSVLSIVLAVIVPFIVYQLIISQPASVAKKRGKDIDNKISPAMNFISALASANVTPDIIFKELARRKEYGEIANEAEWITRDTELLGKDILTSLKDASKRSPSLKWTEFLQGVVTTSTSGGALKPYFILKSDEYEKELRLQMKKTMETLSLFAETFVTVGVAFPLFLIIIIAIMALINQSMAPVSVMVLYVIVFLMLPVLIGMFAFFIHSTSAEVTK